MRRLLVLLLFLLTPFAVAQEATLQFEQANQLYRSGDFRKAAEMYEQIVKGDNENPMLYYNLGNAYFKLQEIPSAILNYERAKRLAPHDEDVLYNLRLANLRITDKIEPLPRLFFEEWWRILVTLFSSDGWSVVGIVGLWCAAVGGAMFITTHSFLVQRLAFVISSFTVLVCVLACIGMFQQLHREQTEQHAIVFSPSVPVKSAPDNQSTDLFVLHEGINVELLDTVGDWNKIRLADGKIGWMVASSIHVI